MNNLTGKLESIIRRLEQKVPYASALYKRRSGTRINVNRVQESVEPEDPSQGFVFTLWNGQQFFEYSVNHDRWDDIEADLSDVARMAMSSRKKGEKSTDIDPGPSNSKNFVSPYAKDPDEVPLLERLTIARNRLKAALGADPMVTNAISILGNTTSEDVFVNRSKQMSQIIRRVDAILVVFVSDGENTTDLHIGTSKNGGLEKAVISDEEIRNVVEDGKRLLKAPRLKPGLYDVVTDPEWSGIIAHECFGHGMETDLYTRGRAMSQKFLSKPVASKIVNMFDDPSMIDESGGFFFDDEGQIANSTHIIKDGILQRGLTDMASAHKLKMKRSANGRRESFVRKAYARMTNTFFENGKNTKDQMISSIQNGVYLRHATNGMEDPQAWGIQVEGLWAEEIKNGKLTGTVFSPVIMTGFVPDLLKSISMVGDDRHISGLGMCGKGHKEWVKNTTGGPHLKMKARLA